MFFYKSGRRDFLIIAALLCAAVILGAPALLDARRPLSLYAEIIYEGQIVETVDLGRERRFSIDELPNVVFEVNDNKVSFVSSDCPDKVCVNTGWLGAHGQHAACLPNKVVLRVADRQGAGGAGGVDGVSR